MIRKTNDGGKTWKMVMDTIILPNNQIEYIHFSDSLNGIASSLSKIFKTTDAGETWFIDTSYHNLDLPYNIGNVLLIDKYKAVGLSMNDYNLIYRYTADRETSVKDNTVEYNIITYPNPAKEELRFLFAEDFHFNDFIIYDSKGDMVMKGVFDPATDIINQKLDIGNLAKGAYYIKLTKPGITAYSQFIKE